MPLSYSPFITHVQLLTRQEVFPRETARSCRARKLVGYCPSLQQQAHPCAGVFKLGFWLYHSGGVRLGTHFSLSLRKCYPGPSVYCIPKKCKTVLFLELFRMCIAFVIPIR